MPGLGYGLGCGLGLQRPTLTRTFSMADPSPSKLFDGSDLSLPDGFFDKCTSITSTTHEDVDDTQDGRPFISGSDDLPLEATYPSSETDPPLEQLPFLPLPSLPFLPPLEALPSTTTVNSIKQPPSKPAQKAPQKQPSASRLTTTAVSGTTTRKRVSPPTETPTPPTQPARKKRRGQRAGTYQCLINGELYDCPFHYDIVPKSLIMSMLTRGTQ